MDVHVQRTVPISYEMVAKAYQKVRQGGKAVGVDGQSWKIFEEQGVEKQLYVIWNRLSSGSYHPQALREVEIPKKNGKKRKLGIPTLRDRIAQEVARSYMEKRIDHEFHENSYGYRPMKSSHEALEEVRKNCLEKDWVVDLDIKQFFDEIDHDLMLKAVDHMHEERWLKVYITRWLKMKIERSDGSQYDRGDKGTPQGGVISPLLANLYLHFALDKWLTHHHPEIRFVRYADDVVLHCSSKEEAENILAAIRARLAEVKLSLNEEKSRIVYCKDYARRETHDQVQFGFLGFSFQPRKSESRQFPGTSFTTFSGEISGESQHKIWSEIRDTINWRDSRQSITEIAEKMNAKLRGWINYFGLFGKRKLRYTLLYFDKKLLKWFMRRHKSGYRAAIRKLTILNAKAPIFHHWRYGFGINVKEMTRAV